MCGYGYRAAVLAAALFTIPGTAAAEPPSQPAALVYVYVTPAGPGSTAPLALRRANAKPSTFMPSYGSSILPQLRLAADAKSSQRALDAILAIPYQGHETSVVALFGMRDSPPRAGKAMDEIVEIYLPSEPVSLSDVAQRDALYQVRPASGGAIEVRLVNERAYPAAKPSALSFDYRATKNATAAKAAVSSGSLFQGIVTVQCERSLGLMTCKAPTAIAVRSVFQPN